MKKFYFENIIFDKITAMRTETICPNTFQFVLRQFVDNPPRSLQVSKQNLRKGRWSSSAVASNLIHLGEGYSKISRVSGYA